MIEEFGAHYSIIRVKLDAQIGGVSCILGQSPAPISIHSNQG